MTKRHSKLVAAGTLPVGAKVRTDDAPSYDPRLPDNPGWDGVITDITGSQRRVRRLVRQEGAVREDILISELTMLYLVELPKLEPVYT